MNKDSIGEGLKHVVLAHLKTKDMDSLKRVVNDASEHELLTVISNLFVEDKVIVYRLLAKDKALSVFEGLGTHSQQELIRSFTEEAAVEMIEELPPDDRVRLLDELPAKVAKRMLAALSSEEREMTNLLMGYEAHTAGRIMTPEYVQLPQDISISEALDRIRESACDHDTETIYTAYITDEARKLQGVVSLRDILIADPADSVANVMRQTVERVSTDTDQEETARLFQRLDLLALPVVDREHRLVGIITVDDAMDILEEGSTDSMFAKAGISDLTKNEAAKSEVLVNGSLWRIWRVRLPFLFLTLVGGLLAGTVIDSYEEMLASVVIVAVFIPVIMDMGGNVGIQSSTVFLRGIILGHIHTEQLWRHISKEVLVGFSMGMFSGVVTGLAAWWWKGVPQLGLAVGLSLMIVMTFASFLGYIVPYILMRLNIDQAAGTDPIITTIKDVGGLLVYFGLVSYFLGHLL